jgi:hypothetical protein
MSKQKRTILWIVGIVGAVGALSAYQYVQTRVMVLEVNGTITHLDAQTRKASLEFVSPRNGKLTEMSCEVPPECTLQLNGAPAALEEFKAGDRADVTVRWDRKKKLAVPLSVNVERAAEG